MKAASFDYVVPKTVAEASASLASNGATTVAIAGGQSLLPMLNQGEAAVLYCFVFLYFAFAGAGAWSLDGMRQGAASRA